jgi:hypothetical protein
VCAQRWEGDREEKSMCRLKQINLYNRTSANEATISMREQEEEV